MHNVWLLLFWLLLRAGASERGPWVWDVGESHGWHWSHCISLFGRKPRQQAFCQVAECTRFPFVSWVFELCLQKHFNDSSVMYWICTFLLLHWCSREERNQRADKEFQLVFDFSRILSTAVTRYLLLFTIQCEGKDYTRKDLLQTWVSRTGRDLWYSDSRLWLLRD